jgi:hypothetical protein
MTPFSAAAAAECVGGGDAIDHHVVLSSTWSSLCCDIYSSQAWLNGS